MNNKKSALIKDFNLSSQELRNFISDYLILLESSEVSSIISAATFYADTSIQLLENLINLSYRYFVSKSEGDKETVLKELDSLNYRLSTIKYVFTEELEKAYEMIKIVFLNLKTPLTK